MKNLKTLQEIQFSYYRTAGKGRVKIVDAEQVHQLLLPEWQAIDNTQEMKILMLDGQSRLVASVNLMKLGIHKLVQHPENLFNTIPAYQSEYLILVHNISKKIDPDIVQMIRELANIARIMGLLLLDHLIVTSRKYSSVLGQPYPTVIQNRTANEKKRNEKIIWHSKNPSDEN